MNRSSKPAFGTLLFFAIAFALSLYFAFAAIQGNYGLFRRAEIVAEAQDLRVIGIARHSETQEELVVYRQEYGDNGLWVRPLAMFVETVEVDGKLVARFERMEEEG